MSELDEAIERYKAALAGMNPGRDGYSTIELPKMEIADALLKMLQIATEPTESPEPLQQPTVAAKIQRIGFVYLMKNQRNGYTKIGWSTQPSYREKTLQSEEPEVSIIGFWPGTMAMEFALHAKYAAYRLRGEWFDLTVNDIVEIKLTMGGQS